ncbi:MAG: anhydro-N-acetylmuramic acid kinase [Pseudomonadota bacterium]
MNTLTEKFEPIWVAGFMSGTSIDAVDGALILTDGERVLDFGPTIERKYTPEEREVLQVATHAALDWNWRGPQPEAAFKAARAVIVSTHAAAWERLRDKASGREIALVGVHGQTVLHRPPTDTTLGATLQLMDAPALQARIGLPLAYDFRSDDVAAGGQGAPLAPVYHRALLDRDSAAAGAVLNLGGVANVTACLTSGEMLAFDTGPANGPIDEWVEGHDAGTHDAGGQLAARGRVHDGLLAQLLEHPWFQMPPPKSLDRYDFNASMARGLSLEDGAATLTAFTAHAVSAGLNQLPIMPERLIACGGGRHNPTLMRMLADVVPCQVLSAEQVGWRGDSIEAEAFAYLAARTLRGLPISWPKTTGAPSPLTGGRIEG